MLSVLNSVSSLLYAIPVLAIGAVIFIKATVEILREYERAVVFNIGRFQRVRGPGLMLFEKADKRP